MTVVDRPARTFTEQTRPAFAKIASGELVFLGITAVTGGGLGFFVETGMRDNAWFEEIPLISSWLLPGLLLGLGFGIGSLVTAYGVIRRPRWAWLAWVEDLTGYHWSWTATLTLGIGMIAWIGLQLIWLAPQILHLVYGLVGITLAGLTMSRSLRSYLRPSE